MSTSSQIPLYKCNNVDGECENAVKKITFPIRQGEELKCPVCGKRDIELVKGQKTGGTNGQGVSPWPKILLVAGIAAVLILLGYGIVSLAGHGTHQNQPYLVLAGSNTIGETLAPELVKGYLENIGATGITEHPKMNDGKEIKDEKQIEAMLDGKEIVIEIRAHGSKTGFRDLLNDSADIGMASEPINDSIYQRFLAKKPNENMRSFTSENIIGHDGIAVFVNADNHINELSIDQVRQIFIDGGHITEWGSNPSSGINGPLHLYRRDDNSGTTGMFKAMVLHGGGFDQAAQKIEKSEELVAKVTGDPNGIGYVGYTFTKDVNGIKVLALKAAEGLQALIPLPVTIKNEKYPLSRRLFMYCLNSDTNSHIRPFLQFVLNRDAGQKIVDRSGFINLTPVTDTTALPADLPPGYADLTRNAQKQSIIFRFNFGSAVLDNLAEGDLKRLLDLTYLPENRNKKVILVGFADNVGSDEANLRISQERADIVKQRLLQMFIPVQAVQGFGSSLPVHNNNDERERGLNRRVEVWLTN